MEEGSHRCGRALGRYKSLWCKLLQWRCCKESGGVNDSGCVKQYTHAYTKTHTQIQETLPENIWIRATCLEEVISFTRGTGEKEGGGGGEGEVGEVVPSWMCNLHASLHRWERPEDEVESEERANQMTHFARIKC